MNTMPANLDDDDCGLVNNFRNSENILRTHARLGARSPKFVILSFVGHNDRVYTIEI
jgi:hypothetical protein